MSGAAEVAAYGYGSNDEEQGVDLYLSERGLMPDVSEMRFDESVIRRSMGMLDGPSMEFIEEEEIVEEYEESEVMEEEEEYEEVLVLTDDDEEEVTDDEQSNDSPPPPQGAYPSSGEGSPPELSNFPRLDSGPTLYVSSDEEEIVEGEVDEAILVSYPEVRLAKATKSIENSPLTSDMIFTTSSSGAESDIEIEEKLVVAIQGSPLASDAINEAASDEASQVLDFPPCFDVTDENEEELTRRLHGAMHPALDVWDQRLPEVMAPRPATPPGIKQRGSEPTRDHYSSITTIHNPSKDKTPTNSGLAWAAGKLADMVYPQNYCVPPITTVEDVMKNMEDSKEIQDKKKYVRKKIRASKEEQEGGKEPNSGHDASAIASHNQISVSVRSLSEEKQQEPIEGFGASTSTINTSSNVLEDMETPIADLDASTLASQNQKTVNEKSMVDTNQEEPVEDTDVSTSASTSSNASVSSSTAALSSRGLFWAIQGSMDTFFSVDKQSPPPITDANTSASSSSNASMSSSTAALSSRGLFWAVQGSMNTVYPIDKDSTPTIAIVEEEDGVNSQCLKKEKQLSTPPIDEKEDGVEIQCSSKEKQIINPKIFARRLRQYQQEKAKDPSRWRNSLRMPESDDLSAPLRRPKLQGKEGKTNSIYQKSPDHLTSLQSPGLPENQNPQQGQQEKWRDPFDRDERDNEEDQFHDEPMPSPPGNPATDIRGGRKKPVMASSPRLRGAEVTEIQQEVETWDDEEAQNIPPKPKRFRLAPLADEIYNTDPACYNPDFVVYERELMIVPKRERKEPMSAGEKKRKLISRMIFVLLLIVPFSVGAYLTLRKGV